MQMTKKTGIWLLIAVVVVFGVVLGWRLFSARSKATAQSSRIMTARVERGDLEVKVSGTGTVEAAVSEEVRTQMSGTITRYEMKEGQQVQAGQVLAELEVEDMGLQIEKARLNIAIQERELATLRQEKTQQTVKAPGSGEITWLVKEGDQVQKNNVIATIQNRNMLEAVGKFNSAQVKHIKIGQKAEVLLPEFFSTVPARVVEVDTYSKPGSSGSILYDVKVELDNPGALDAGMLGQLTVFTPAGEQRAVEDVTLANPEGVDVRAPISGKITRLQVDSGKTVESGQLLAEINDPDRTDELADQIATAELKLQQARIDLEEKLRQHSEQAQKSQVLAPVSGIVVLPEEAIGVGDDVNQGTVLGTIVDNSRMKVVIPVDELDVTKVKPGQQVRITADALEGKEFSGQVVSVASQGVSESGVATFDVSIAIEPVEGLRVGMTVNADIIVDHRQNTLLVPIEAVQKRGNRSIVLVADNEEKDNAGTSRPVQVKTGAYDTSRMEILEGLEEGQEVIVQSTGSSNVQRQGGFFMPGMGGGPPQGYNRQQGGSQGSNRQQGGGR